MLSFELSFIDVVLTIAIVVILLLLIKQRQVPPTTKAELTIKPQRNIFEKPSTPPLEIANEESSTTQPSGDFQECVHHFGYLKNLPQNTPVPEECFGCPKVLRCLFPDR